MTLAKRPAVRKRSTKRKASTRKGPSTASRAAKKKTSGRAAASRTRTRKPVPKPSRVAAATALIVGAAKGAAAAVARRLPGAKVQDDPIVLLEADHRRFEALLEQGEATTERAATRRSQLLNTLTAALNVHEAIEEQILYPALKPHAETHDIVLEGYQEHHVADVIIRELHQVAKSDEKWGAKFKVLEESLAHHIQEEERKMFPTARAVLTTEELNDLGARMKTLKAQLEKR
jgi:hemerythrin